MSDPDYEWYEAEDCGCSCNEPDEEGFCMESQWEWDEEQGVWECSGCGEIQ